MENNYITVKLVIKRYDKIEQETSTANLRLNTKAGLDSIKQTLDELLNLTECNNKIFKLRSHDGFIIPMSSLLENNDENEPFILEVMEVHQNLPAKSRTHLYEAYIHAVRSRIQAMDNRLAGIESLIPQIQFRRQTLVERTVHTLSTKVAFLDRRLDELTPSQWKTATTVV